MGRDEDLLGRLAEQVARVEAFAPTTPASSQLHAELGELHRYVDWAISSAPEQLDEPLIRRACDERARALDQMGKAYATGLAAQRSMRERLDALERDVIVADANDPHAAEGRSLRHELALAASAVDRRLQGALGALPPLELELERALDGAPRSSLEPLFGAAVAQPDPAAPAAAQAEDPGATGALAKRLAAQADRLSGGPRELQSGPHAASDVAPSDPEPTPTDTEPQTPYIEPGTPEPSVRAGRAQQPCDEPQHELLLLDERVRASVERIRAGARPLDVIAHDADGGRFRGVRGADGRAGMGGHGAATASEGGLVRSAVAAIYSQQAQAQHAQRCAAAAPAASARPGGCGARPRERLSLRGGDGPELAAPPASADLALRALRQGGDGGEGGAAVLRAEGGSAGEGMGEGVGEGMGEGVGEGMGEGVGEGVEGSGEGDERGAEVERARAQSWPINTPSPSPSSPQRLAGASGDGTACEPPHLGARTLTAGSEGAQWGRELLDGVSALPTSMRDAAGGRRRAFQLHDVRVDGAGGEADGEQPQHAAIGPLPPLSYLGSPLSPRSAQVSDSEEDDAAGSHRHAAGRRSRGATHGGKAGAARAGSRSARSSCVGISDAAGAGGSTTSLPHGMLSRRHSGESILSSTPSSRSRRGDRKQAHHKARWPGAHTMRRLGLGLRRLGLGLLLLLLVWVAFFGRHDGGTNRAGRGRDVEHRPQPHRPKPPLQSDAPGSSAAQRKAQAESPPSPPVPPPPGSPPPPPPPPPHAPPPRASSPSPPPPPPHPPPPHPLDSLSSRGGGGRAQSGAHARRGGEPSAHGAAAPPADGALRGRRHRAGGAWPDAAAPAVRPPPASPPAPRTPPSAPPAMPPPPAPPASPPAPPKARHRHARHAPRARQEAASVVAGTNDGAVARHHRHLTEPSAVSPVANEALQRAAELLAQAALEAQREGRMDDALRLAASAYEAHEEAVAHGHVQRPVGVDDGAATPHAEPSDAPLAAPFAEPQRAGGYADGASVTRHAHAHARLEARHAHRLRAGLAVRALAADRPSWRRERGVPLAGAAALLTALASVVTIYAGWRRRSSARARATQRAVAGAAADGQVAARSPVLELL
ncbi:hypothetical protein KFE25_012597 [Diacronema lutheri]|uniref:Uncharacterized protein n=1 Tax=Diacronema lutheri TaxID=2081491 RepID=A0A8J6CA68_DIALT|nr:hypothetical protein KFE25_012597 [Diacronema lutheri]